MALNFANAINLGGGFLNGTLAQEEYLCRSSALFLTNEFCGVLSHVTFAVTDWSPERKFFGPVRDIFGADSAAFQVPHRHFPANVRPSTKPPCCGNPAQSTR